jgi:hypothetical protein
VLSCGHHRRIHFLVGGEVGSQAVLSFIVLISISHMHDHTSLACFDTKEGPNKTSVR